MGPWLSKAAARWWLGLVAMRWWLATREVQDTSFWLVGLGNALTRSILVSQGRGATRQQGCGQRGPLGPCTSTRRARSLHKYVARRPGNRERGPKASTVGSSALADSRKVTRRRRQPTNGLGKEWVMLLGGTVVARRCHAVPSRCIVVVVQVQARWSSGGSDALLLLLLLGPPLLVCGGGKGKPKG